MAKELYPLKPNELKEYLEWAEERPPPVREIALRLRPNQVYYYRPAHQWVLVRSVCEDGTVTVYVIAALNPGLVFERWVFGVDPLDLEEVDVPDHFDLKRRPLIQGDEEVRAFCDALAKAHGLR